MKDHTNKKKRSWWRSSQNTAHVSPVTSLASTNMREALVPRDVQIFIDNYPGKTDSKDPGNLNLRFYRNEIPARTSGDHSATIEQIHACVRLTVEHSQGFEHLLSNWKGDYQELEWNHGYIQWLYVRDTSSQTRHNSSLSLQISHSRTRSKLQG